ncbi:ribosome biogenesis GTP-binding protein YihA/YsxC [Burkholderiaceae bacterium FT117]|uniref:ribosome biogenesis GTP-binding protein YihA/YsxC n=1 Tax=Zeimonas sediminis TaxID=2944268 RepID=UPI0023432191|nr:ribosome biogenesis GTP-binding protein YihA/YsxC [Zeimonas sediminis]MCM5570883.1 ribosome biogenesis GTP-binding protein YihA/YsxC [Zeimonas sediminis]
MASLLPTARFATTVAKLAQLPRDGLPEIAFVGRSNAGKSSAINALCRRKRLAFASKTPGRTQALNCFALGPESAPAPVALIVDTPGYGFAAAPLEVKRGWDQLAGRYLQIREALAAVVLVLDVRRGVTELDRALLRWLRPGVPVLVILTKSDKLGRAEQRKALDGVEAALREARLPNPISLLAFSSTTGLGVEQARAWLDDAISNALDPKDSTEDPT